MYAIVRFFFRDRSPRVIKKGLTLEEAQRHCRNPESSSSTCTNSAAKQRTKWHGPWFDGYRET